MPDNSWGRRPVAGSIITPPCPAGGGGKAVIPCRYCGAPRKYVPRVLTARFFTCTAYLGGGVSRLPQNTTQPYPAGALHIFTSSLANAVWQLHFSYPAGALRPASSAAADYAATGIFTGKRSLATSLLFRRPDSAGHTTAVIPHALHDRLELITQVAQELSYLTGNAAQVVYSRYGMITRGGGGRLPTAS